MDKKIAVVIAFLVVVILVMAGFLVKDYVSFGKPEAEVAVTGETTGQGVPEAEGAETTMVAAATTAAGAVTTTAGGTTNASGTTVATTTAVVATTTAAGTTQSLNITTTSPQVGGIVTTTHGLGGLVTTTQGLGGIATTTTQGMGLWVTTTGTMAIIGDLTTTAGKPDLLIPTPLTIMGSNLAKPNDYIDLSSWTALNLGTAASGICKYGIYLSTSSTLNPRGRHLWEGTVPRLLTGQSASIASTSVKIPHDWPAGTYYLGIYVDDHLTVDELNENNNYSTVKIIID